MGLSVADLRDADPQKHQWAIAESAAGRHHGRHRRRSLRNLNPYPGVPGVAQNGAAGLLEEAAEQDGRLLFCVIREAGGESRRRAHILPLHPG